MDEIYFVAQTQTTESGVTQSIFRYNTRDDAEEAYHSTCTSNYAAAKAGTLKAFVVALMNAKLYPEEREIWSAPAPEPNTEE